MNDAETIWSARDVADYLRVSPRTVTEKYAAKPWFPRPFRLPSDKGRGGLRWKKSEIIEWTMEQAK